MAWMVWALASVTAQGMLVLQPGESAIFHLDGGRPVLDRAEPSGTARPDQLTARMAIDVPGGPSGTILVITSNATGMLDYHAFMSVNGQSQPTSVCTLLGGGKPTFEHWPYQVDVLAIGGFVPAGAMHCQ